MIQIATATPLRVAVVGIGNQHLNDHVQVILESENYLCLNYDVEDTAIAAHLKG